MVKQKRGGTAEEQVVGRSSPEHGHLSSGMCHCGLVVEVEAQDTTLFMCAVVPSG